LDEAELESCDFLAAEVLALGSGALPHRRYQSNSPYYSISPYEVHVPY